MREDCEVSSHLDLERALSGAGQDPRGVLLRAEARRLPAQHPCDASSGHRRHRADGRHPDGPCLIF